MIKLQVQALRESCLHGSAWVRGNPKSKKGFKVCRFLWYLWLWFMFLVQGIDKPSLNKKQGIYDLRQCITCWISFRDNTSSDPEILSVDSECVESFQIQCYSHVTSTSAYRFNRIRFPPLSRNGNRQCIPQRLFFHESVGMLSHEWSSIEISNATQKNAVGTGKEKPAKKRLRLVPQSPKAAVDSKCVKCLNPYIFLFLHFFITGIAKEKGKQCKRQGMYDLWQFITCWILFREDPASDAEHLSNNSECVNFFPTKMLFTHPVYFSIPAAHMKRYSIFRPVWSLFDQNMIVSPVKKRKQGVRSPRYVSLLQICGDGA